jgi:hypothetical protein
MLAIRLLALIMGVAAAPTFGGQEIFRVANEGYRSECGSCHIPYPPALLPRESWQAIVADLHNHFGSDASIDATTARGIEAYLIANAARRPAPADRLPPLRITATRWFVHEHDEVPATLWKSSGVKSPSNCSACHPRAEQGEFSEHAVRLPKP